MHDDSARVFTASWQDPALRKRLCEARDTWRWPPGAKPVVDAALHLTLQFIGAFPRPRMAELESALATLETAPIVLRAFGAELWHGGIAVLRFAAEPALMKLHEDMAAAWVVSTSRSTRVRSRRTSRWRVALAARPRRARN